MMTCTNRLAAGGAAAALFSFSVSFVFYSGAPLAQEAKSSAEIVAAAAGVHSPKFRGKRNRGAIANIIRDLRDGGLVVTFGSDGEINAYALEGPNVTVVEDGPPPPSGVPTYGEGNITDIMIYKGSDCITCLLNGRRVTVCKN